MNLKQSDFSCSKLLLCALLITLIPTLCLAVEVLPQIPLVAVKGGCFEMGDSFGDGGSDEKPAHTVCVDDFSMARHEVTQELWLAVMGSNPSRFRDTLRNPVENVSWDDAQEFIRRLNDKSGAEWRLPTEAEWEYAARGGGLKQRFAGTSAGEYLNEYAWHDDNSRGVTHPVESKLPNRLGLYDMSGNVWEWCSDRYDRTYYKQSPRNNPKGDPFGINRVMRGGSASSKGDFLRSSYREYVAANKRGNMFGLRLVQSSR
jgi:formylglycine-generating enzyme required for sulfatase activity